MEYLKIILGALLAISFIVVVTVLRINIRNKKKHKNDCNNPDMSDKKVKCGDCSLTELCNYKDS